MENIHNLKRGNSVDYLEIAEAQFASRLKKNTYVTKIHNYPLLSKVLYIYIYLVVLLSLVFVKYFLHLGIDE